MSVCEALCGNIYYALYNGGPNTLVWSVVIVFFGAMAQAASLGEMTSILPLAGAQYHWSVSPTHKARIPGVWTRYRLVPTDTGYQFVSQIQSS